MEKFGFNQQNKTFFVIHGFGGRYKDMEWTGLSENC